MAGEAIKIGAPMSGQGRPTERPYRPSPFRSRAARRQQEESSDECRQRASERFAIWQYQTRLDQALPVRERFQAVRRAIQEGELSAPAIGQSTFYRIVALGGAADGTADIRTFFEHPRTGRPPRPLHPDLAEMLRERLLAPTTRSRAAHLRALTKEAVRRRMAEDDQPTRRQVDAFIRSVPPAEIAAARHGRNAAMLDTVPKATVPAEFTHDIWTFDETELPIWARVTDPVDGSYRAVKPWAVFVMDNFSRAVIGFRLVRPFYHVAGSDQVWSTARHHKEDIVGTLMAAAIPELAPDELVQFSGRLPRTLRADKDGTHGMAAKLAHDLTIEYPELVPGRPWLRGNIERVIGTIKRRLGEIPGSTEQVEVAERTTEDPRDRRKRATNSLYRDRATDAIPTIALRTVEEIEKEVLAVIKTYNETPHKAHRKRKDEKCQTPAYVFRDGLTGAARRNRDIVEAFPAKVRRVSREGLVVDGTAYMWKGVGIRFHLNDEVKCYTEPLRRAAFVMNADGTYHTLYEKTEYARRMMAADRVDVEIRAERAPVARASEAAGYARAARIADQFGPGVKEEGDRILKAKLENVRSTKRTAERATRARRKKDSAERESAVSAPAEAPAPTPAAPVRVPRPSIPMAPPFTKTVVLKFPAPRRS